MLSDETLSANLLTLFNSMKEKPMGEKDYADKLAKILDDQIKTAEVQPGITVATTGTQNAQTGATTGTGKIL